MLPHRTSAYASIDYFSIFENERVNVYHVTYSLVDLGMASLTKITNFLISRSMYDVSLLVLFRLELVING